MNGRKVIVLGGGVAGMSAAHELVERGFEVHVYELKSIPGGKARSIPVPHSGKDGRSDLPGEHGFRFFPRFYRHITDTMKRMPYGNNKNGVFDNLVQTTRILVTQDYKPGVTMLSRFPRSAHDWEVALDEVRATETDIGLKPGELTFFAERIWQIMTSSEARREDEYERIGWWTFIGADTRSPGYQKFLAAGLTRSLVAAKARLASARLEGDIGLQLFLDLGEPGISADRVLDGPTNDVWLHPWLEYLRARGVQYHLEHRLNFLNCVDGRIQNVEVVGPEGPVTVSGDYYVVAVPLEVIGRILAEERHKPILQADPGLEGILTFRQYVAWMNGLQLYIKRDIPIVNGHAIYVDSPWAITSISQKQFWPNTDLSQYGDGTVQGIISVDISDWQTPGSNGKTADECTPEEIKDEVLHQIMESLNIDGKVILSKDDVIDWFLDPDIRPRLRKDLDLYNDAEPLMVAEVNTWHLRPDAHTRIPNLFLAADYIRTNTQLATMEAANEAARRAVNAIIIASGADAPLCKIWKLQEPGIMAIWRWYDRRRYDRGEPWSSGFPWFVEIMQRILIWVVQLSRKLRS